MRTIEEPHEGGVVDGPATPVSNDDGTPNNPTMTIVRYAPERDNNGSLILPVNVTCPELVCVANWVEKIVVFLYVCNSP